MNNPGTYYPLSILYDADGMPLAYYLSRIEYTGGGGATVDHLEISEREIVVGVGKSQKLKVYAVYTNGNEKDVTSDKGLVVRSESASIADVSKGTVTGKKEGSTRLVISFAGQKLQVNVQVTKDPLISLKASTRSATISVGDTKQIKLTGVYSNGSAKDVTGLAFWMTDDSEVADVEGGDVDAVAEGTTKITATYAGQTVEIEVTVVPEDEEELVEYVSLVTSNKNIKMLPGEEKTVLIYGIKENGEKDEITSDVVWQTSKSDVVDTDSGILTAGKPGKAIVYVSYGQAEYAINVEVVKEKAIKTLTTSPKKVELKRGAEKQLYAQVTYIDNAKLDVTDRAEWTVKNETILEVDNGTVTALKKGKTIITVKYNGKSANIEVTVK